MKYKKNNEDNLILPAEQGPFHIIGDVHGCSDELQALLQTLDYAIEKDPETGNYTVQPPAGGYKVIFVGDLVDRGPDSPEVLRLVMDMVEQGVAFCSIGNHDEKLVRKLNGAKVHIRHGLEVTLEQLSKCSKDFVDRVRRFLGKLPHHIVLDYGRLVVAHAGLPEEHHGRLGGKVRALCLYGPTDGGLDEHGLPVRLDWAADYCGNAVVVYGHTPVKEPRLLNNTINIDTGCVFGGMLTALSYPDNIQTSIQAFATYAESARPFLEVEATRIS